MSERFPARGYLAPDLARIQHRLARAEALSKKPGATDELLDALRKLEQDVARFQEAQATARRLARTADEHRDYYRQEADRLDAFEEELAEAREKLLIPLLYSPDLPAIARSTGPLFLYRRQNAEMFREAEPRLPSAEARATDEDLHRQASERRGTPGDISRKPSPARPNEVFLDDLISRRSEDAKRHGFATYMELAWFKQERFDYDRADMDHLRQQVLRYLVPIGRAYRAYWSRPPVTLRDPDRPGATYYHMAPVLHTRATVDMCIEAFLRVWPQFPRDAVTLQITQDVTKPTTLRIDSLPASGRAVMRGTFRPDWQGVYKLWTHLAEVMIYTVQATQSWILENRMPTPDVYRTIRHSAAALAMVSPQTEDLWHPGEAECLRGQLLWTTLYDLLCFAMLDDYERRIYDHPGFSISERGELWTEVAKLYWPGPVAPQDRDYFPLRYRTVLSDLLEWEPGGSLNQLLGLLEALLILDLEKQRPGEGYKAVHLAVMQCGRLPFRSLLDLCGMPPLLAEDSLKRLAYQISYHLGL